MKSSRLLSLLVFPCVLSAWALALVAGVFAADESSAGAKTFNSIYGATLDSHIGDENAAAGEADDAANEKKYVEASAKYLVAASGPFRSRDFERARPNLDKAFLFAAKMPVADQKEMLNTLSTIVANAREIHDDIWKYLAQQRLKLMQSQPGMTATEKYSEIQTLALSCSSHKRYQEAEALLLATLEDLQSMKPTPESVGWCESILARVYDEAGDLDKAKEYYSRWIQFAKEIHDSDQLTRGLGEYTNFLSKHKMRADVVPVAEEYFRQATSPEQARWRDRVSFGMIARDLSDIDENEADKYYRAAFENEKEMTKSAMNAGYGQTICEWAEMLNKYGKTKEAISVLNEGMSFCRSSKWPDALDSYMPQMASKCEEILRASGRTAEANNLDASFVNEMALHKRKLANEKERQLADAVSNPNARPVQKVSALTELAYRSFAESKCNEAMNYLNEAVQVYEANAGSKDNPRMYGSFSDISLRLAKCGKAEESIPMLLRIVKARMVYGFPDPAKEGVFIACGGRQPIAAFDDLFPAYTLLNKGKADSKREELLKRLLDEAKNSDKISNVIYLLIRQSDLQTTNEGKIASLEELELWRSKENDVGVLLQSMMRTADMYMYLKQYDKMMEKCSAALEVAEKADGSNKTEGYPFAGAFANIANNLVSQGQLRMAGDMYLAGYRRSLHERGEYNSQLIMDNIDRLANKYRDSGDVDSGAKLLEGALDVSKAALGRDGTMTRSCLMKLSTYYVVSDQRDNVKKINRELIASVTKPGMSIGKSTADEMTALAHLLQDKGFIADSSKIENRLRLLEQQQCAPR